MKRPQFHFADDKTAPWGYNSNLRCFVEADLPIPAEDVKMLLDEIQRLQPFERMVRDEVARRENEAKAWIKQAEAVTPSEG